MHDDRRGTYRSQTTSTVSGEIRRDVAVAHIILLLYTVIIICAAKRSKTGGSVGDHRLFRKHRPRRRRRQFHRTHASFLLYWLTQTEHL